MGYLHIDNLYKNQDVLAFKRVYALEKIHGTSAHLRFTNNLLTFFSGGEKHDKFKACFDEATLLQGFAAVGHHIVTVYGEAYGGKCQGMSATYGKELKFIAFDVRVGDTWLAVPNAAAVVAVLGLIFVPYELINATVENLDHERDRPSRVAMLCGCGVDKASEGIVIRPPFEVTKSNGERIIAKHKGEAFAETRTTRPVVDPANQQALDAPRAIADEWVTSMRLGHVMDKMGDELQMSDIPRLIAAMQEDVLREATGEIVESRAALKAIGSATVKLFTAHVKGKLI